MSAPRPPGYSGPTCDRCGHPTLREHAAKVDHGDVDDVGYHVYSFVCAECIFHGQDTLKVEGKLRVIAAACTAHGKTYVLAPPKRHHDVMGMMWDKHRVRFHGSGGESGFMLNDGRFVMRKAALHLVLTNGQLTKDLIGGQTLTTEDLW